MIYYLKLYLAILLLHLRISPLRLPHPPPPPWHLGEPNSFGHQKVTPYWWCDSENHVASKEWPFGAKRSWAPLSATTKVVEGGGALNLYK